MTIPLPPPQNSVTGAPIVQVASGGSSPYTFTPLGYQQITAVSGTTALTPPAGATIAFITVEGAAARYRDDGAAPTATVGMPLAVGQPLVYSGSLSAIKFIQQSAGAILDVSYYK